MIKKLNFPFNSQTIESDWKIFIYATHFGPVEDFLFEKPLFNKKKLKLKENNLIDWTCDPILCINF